MNLQEAAAWEIHSFLTSIGMRYAIIGGMAVQWWGEPRLTKDVDLTVAAPLDDPESFIRQVADVFAPRIEDPVAFARRNRIILVQASNGCPLDISMGLPGYEEEVMERAVEVELEPGKEVRLCSAEDLIIHKALADPRFTATTYRWGLLLLARKVHRARFCARMTSGFGTAYRWATPEDAISWPPVTVQRQRSSCQPITNARTWRH